MIFLWKQTHSETKSWNSSRTSTKQSCNSNGETLEIVQDFACETKFLHFSSFFLFFFFFFFICLLSFLLLWVHRNLIFCLNCFKISCYISFQKNHFFEPSREVPLWVVFSFVSLVCLFSFAFLKKLFFSRSKCLLFFFLVFLSKTF